MSAVTIIFPHQLFKEHPAIHPQRKIFLVEEELFFHQFSFHQKKILLHRASMQHYAESLGKKGFQVEYVEAYKKENGIEQVVVTLPKTVQEIHVADLVDDWLERRLKNAAAKRDIAIITYPTPMFLNTAPDNEAFFNTTNRYFQTDFYIHQRQRFGWLLEANGKPIGGKWTFDSENREKFPKGQKPVFTSLPINQAYIPDAEKYVAKHFADNYGDTHPPFFRQQGFYPVTHTDAEAWLDAFLSERFKLFGRYEDAMVPGEGLLYHSGLAAMLNIGLLTPSEVLNRAFDAAIEFDVPLNSLEGFVRQVAGWREFIRAVYEREGRTQRTTNFWKFNRKIPKSFWTGETGVGPIDIVIKRVLQNGYTHHIERLMVLGNFFLLCEFDPDDVYRWFMELFIDAYDWVMVPNTYGMVCFADGGLMMTKPYISGSNYLLKMGTWEKGDWQKTWDALFWRFMHVHRGFFLSNPRLGMLVRSFDKMPAEKQRGHLKTADAFLKSLG